MPHLSQLSFGRLTAPVWTANTRDAELHLTKSTNGNGKITAQGFDPSNGRLLSICASGSDPCAGEIQNQSYGWDPAGNLLTRSDTYEGWNETFCYDPWNRLTKYSLDGSTCTQGSDKKVMAYDSGNITRKSDICGSVACYNYGGNGAGPHQLTSITTPASFNGVTAPTFLYDANGNMRCMLGAGQTCTAAHAARYYSWTSFNQPASIVQGGTSVGLAYGDLHQRYKMCTPDCSNPTSTTYYLYDPVTGGMSEKVVSGSSTTWNDYIIADGQIVAVRTKSGSAVSWNYVVGDHLGSPTTVTACGSGCTDEHDSAACPLARERAARGMPGASAAIPMPPTIPAAPSPACSAAASPSTRCWIPSAS